MFQLDDHDFDRLFALVDVGVHGLGRVGGKPVGFAGLPDVRFGGSALFHDAHRAAREGNDDARMIVAMHGERRVGSNDGAPDSNVIIFKVKDTLSLDLRLRLVRAYDGEVAQR